MPDGAAIEGNQETLLYCFVRAESDLDHLAPVIDAIAGDPELRVRLIIVDPLKRFEQDYRVLHLRAQGIEIVHLFDLAFASASKRRIVRFAQRALRFLTDLSQRSQGQAFSKAAGLASRSVRAFLTARTAEVDVGKLVRSFDLEGKRAIFVFDPGATPLVRSLRSEGRRFGVRTLCLPHSVAHVAHPRSGPEDGFSVFGELFDRVVVATHAEAERLRVHMREPERVLVKGSARFDSTWLRKLAQLAPPFVPAKARNEPQDSRLAKRRVAFVLSKRTPLANWDLVERTIERLSAHPEVALAIKVHTRNDLNGIPISAQGRINTVPLDVPTVSVIEWSELVLFWGSSVVYDAVLKNKDVLFLRYLHSATFDFEPLAPSWRVESLEDLQARIATWVKDRATGGQSLVCLSAEDRRRLVEFVHAGSSTNSIQRYVELFRSDMRSAQVSKHTELLPRLRSKC